MYLARALNGPSIEQEHHVHKRMIMMAGTLLLLATSCAAQKLPVPTVLRHVDFVIATSGSGYSGYIHSVRIDGNGIIRKEERQGINAPLRVSIGRAAKEDMPALRTGVLAFERARVELASCVAVPDVEASVTVSIDGRSQTFVTLCSGEGRAPVEALRRVFTQVMSHADWSVRH
jgi:hypothetical protein